MTVYEFLMRNIVKGKTKEAQLVFNHGLGDFVNFMPLFRALQEAVKPHWSVSIASHCDRQFKVICPEVIAIGKDVVKRVDYHRRVEYPEPIPEFGFKKPELCNWREIGLPEFKWVPWVELTNLVDNKKKHKKRIGVHFYGVSRGANKNVSYDDAIKIWREIEEAGYEPFEIHMKQSYVYHSNVDPDEEKFGEFVQKRTLRQSKADLKQLVNKVSGCQFFIGVDSGPLYVANALLGGKNVLGLQSDVSKIDDYVCNAIMVKSIRPYESGTVKRILEEWNEK